MTAPTVVFDLDGTLVDTAPDLIDTLNVVFARAGLPAVPYETARNAIGGGAKVMIARGVEAEGGHAPAVAGLLPAFEPGLQGVDLLPKGIRRLGLGRSLLRHGGWAGRGRPRGASASRSVRLPIQRRACRDADIRRQRTDGPAD